MGGDEVQREIRRPFSNEIGFITINKFTNASTSPKCRLKYFDHDKVNRMSREASADKKH